MAQTYQQPVKNSQLKSQRFEEKVLISEHEQEAKQDTPLVKVPSIVKKKKKQKDSLCDKYALTSSK